jgi:aryl-alcohol dehydrogenase-like predicted oxidoreductase
LREAARRTDALRRFLAPDRRTLAALALKFCLSHPAVSTGIPGMRKVENVEANAATSDGKLLPREVLEELKDHPFTHGWSYPWAQGM